MSTVLMVKRGCLFFTVVVVPRQNCSIHRLHKTLTY
ncbi:hypothetical protein NC651_027693 [Populus alba x Populus x berolinensis]|nr:hypothetical protein NC651_027693 [Populus alba x Populus x berolinensis]